MSRRARRITSVIALIMLALGLGLFSYPHIRQHFFQKEADAAIAAFQEAAKEQRALKDTPGDQSLDFLLSELYEQMRSYNEKLFLTGQSELRDPFAFELPSFDLAKFGLADNIVGYIEIPRIDVRLPIYLGASPENMNKGAVHLSQTSLPIGGENTNCVIAAHRGSLRGYMFRNIDELGAGDEIRIVNFREALTYRVTSVEIILPDDIEKITIRPGADMITLSTCNPVGYNYQRLIVYAERS